MWCSRCNSLSHFDGPRCARARTRRSRKNPRSLCNRPRTCIDLEFYWILRVVDRVSGDDNQTTRTVRGPSEHYRSSKSDWKQSKYECVKNDKRESILPSDVAHRLKTDNLINNGSGFLLRRRPRSETNGRASIDRTAKRMLLHGPPQKFDARVNRKRYSSWALSQFSHAFATPGRYIYTHVTVTTALRRQGLTELIMLGVGAPNLGKFTGVDKDTGTLNFELDSNRFITPNGALSRAPSSRNSQSARVFRRARLIARMAS